MAFFYYEKDGETYQVIADRYERIQSGEAPEIQLDHAMNSGPISATYPNQIASVTSLGGTWRPHPTQNLKACPVNVSFEGNTINYPFDDPYSDNSGVCSYRVAFLSTQDCRTFFYTGSSTVRVLDFCPPIEEDDRNDGCSKCCRELLPSLQSIRI